MAAAVLLLHTLLLGLLPSVPGAAVQAEARAPMRVRQIVPGEPSEAAQEPPAQAAAGKPTPTSPKAVHEPRSRMGEKEPEAAPVKLAESEACCQAPAPDPSLLPEAGRVSPAEPPPAPEAAGDAVPVYATQLPPAVTLRYSLQRSRNPGMAELQWRPDAGHYQLSWQGPNQAGWVSGGTLDPHGIAPERYTEGRRGRELRAANFQREAGRITFSGPAAQYPLLPGAQDRLSWMLQLAAVMAADPGLAEAGRQVAMFVVGTRGDGDVWTFTVVGTENTDLPDGTAPATVHLQREPRRAYDTGVEVWLDPARHHLPVRALLRIRATGEATELLLQQLSTP